MHLKRWITSLVILPFLILLIGMGGQFLLAVVVNVVCIMALWEYYRIVFHEAGDERMEAQHISTLSFQGLAFISGSAIIWASYFLMFKIIFGVIILNLMGCALISFPRFKFDLTVLEMVFKQVIGVIYIPIFLSCLILVRNGNDGVAWIFFILILVFLGDTGAYYAGSYLGRHKLCPAVSPNKTVEGALGGLAATLAAGAVLKYFVMPSLSWPLSILFFLSIGIAAQAGDLFESELKRTAHVKDSGAFLPGHGGILDRIDALLFAAPVVFFFKEYALCA